MVLRYPECQVVGVAKVSIEQAQVYYEFPVRNPISFFGVYYQVMVPPLLYRLLLFIVTLGKVLYSVAVIAEVLFLLLLLPFFIEKYNKVVSSFSHLVYVAS